MHIPLLILLALLPQEAVEAELRQQQEQMERLERQIRQSQDTLEEIRREQQALARPACSADLRWISGDPVRNVPPGDTVAVQLNLFSTVSRPEATCLPADVRLTVSYLDSSGDPVCTGAIDRVAVQTAPTAHIHLEVRPWNFAQFVWWRNEPPETNAGPRDLFCLNPDGAAQVPPAQLQGVTSLRIWTTVFPPEGGLSTTELVLTLQR